ncbi:MAG TPA: methylmalonyl-CoA mutase family protein, partial [Candidatus Binatia bacterium]|nr:methylmalonyl-CoA mutase family protein [Candidatus Binatia bacterium]
MPAKGAANPARERIRPKHATISGLEVAEVYGPADVRGEIGEPGRYPFTRGVYPTMYRSKPWTMRQFAGFGSARDTNERFKYLLAHGSHGLSTAFDMPTLMGYDADSDRA